MLATWLVVSVAALAGVNGYSSGAPEGSCIDMTPKHPVSPQKSLPPYTVTTSTKSIKAGQPMEVIITGKSASNTVRGLLLEARSGDKPIGKFTLAPGDKFAKLLNCGEAGNAVTHKKHDDKEDRHSLAYTWTPPAGFSGEIKFRATIALNGAVFWVGVESPQVKVTQ